MRTIRLRFGKKYRFPKMRCYHVVCRDTEYHTHHLLAIISPR